MLDGVSEGLGFGVVPLSPFEALQSMKNGPSEEGWSVPSGKCRYGTSAFSLCSLFSAPQELK